MTLRFNTLPPSTNNLYAQVRGKRRLTQKARDAKDAIGWEARSQYRGKPLSGPLAVEIALFWPDRRKHDIDNIKALLDACTGIVWVDDGLIEDLHIIRQVASLTPGVEMRVWEL